MASDRPRSRRSVFGNFRAQVVLRVLLLGLSLMLLPLSLRDLAYPAIPLVIGVLAAFQVWSLIRFVDRTNRDLARFFQAVRYSDFSQTYVTGGLGSSFDELKRSFNEVLDAFRATRAEKEEQALYLQMVVQHIGVGLVAFDRQGEVSLINNAAKRLLRVNRLGNISDLESRGPGLVQTLTTLGPRRKALLRLEEDGEVRQLACFAALFRTGEEEHRLVSLHDIQSELEEQEMEAWQRLIRVLTHEIMNSITPIASLSATAEGLLQQETIAGEDVSDVRTAVHTIQRRSQGLLQFVDAYRDLTRVPAPDFQITPVSGLFERVTQLMAHQFEEAGVEFPGEYREFDGLVEDGEVLIFPSGKRTREALWGVGNKMYFGMSGWALDDQRAHWTGADEAFPFSDHADYEELVGYVEATGAREVYTVFGFPDLARDLRARGLQAAHLEQGASSVQLKFA